MRAIIIDDELHSRETTRLILEDNAPNINIIASAENASKGAELINKLNPELVFLDIQMPEISGIQMLELIPNYKGEIIFITAHDQYAIEAFKKGALHYLLKPIDPDDLLEAISRVKTQNKSNKNNGIWLSLSTMEGWIVVKKHDIIRCEAYKNYTTITTIKTSYTISKTLKDVELKLPKDKFYRIHNSHIINIEFIEKVLKSEGGNILLKNKDLIPISKNKKRAFFNWFQSHIESI